MVPSKKYRLNGLPTQVGCFSVLVGRIDTDALFRNDAARWVRNLQRPKEWVRALDA